MGAGSRRVRAALAIACVVAVCPHGASLAAEEQEGSPRPTRPATSRSASTLAPVTAAGRVARLPLQFEKISSDRGRATFVARGPGYDLTLTPGEAALTLRKPHEHPTGTLRMTLAGGAATPDIAGLDALPGKVYHATAASRGPLSGNSAFRRVKAAGVYPGIDLVYYGNQRHLEFDFLVAPRRDPKQIRLAFSGADRVRLEPGGELSLRVDGEDVRLKAPVIYQERGDIREPVAGGYRILDAAKHHVGFQVGDYDRSRPLVIDPTIVFATYRGGTDDERPNRIEANAIGEVYLFADSRDPSTLPPHPGTQTIPLGQPGFDQCFLTKLSRDGSSAVYTLIFEGAQCQAMALGPEVRSDIAKVHLHVGGYQRTLTESQGNGLTLDLLQGAYDVCQTGSCGSVDWMRTDAAGNVYFIMSYTPIGMAFPDSVYELRKIDTQGQFAGAIQLIQPPLYPSPGTAGAFHDQITSFDVDDSGNAYVIGYGVTPGLITPTANGFQTSRPSGDTCVDPLFGTCYDAFLLKIDTRTPTFQISYASYLGGTLDDRPFGVAWDPASGHIYVTGTSSSSSNFPTTPGAYFTTPSQFGHTGFVVKLDLDAILPQQLRFGTFLGSGESSPWAITVLPGGMAAVAGQAYDWACAGGRCLPLINSLYPRRNQDESRPFLSVLSADGAALRFSTFLDATAGSHSFVSSLASNGSSTIYASMATTDGALSTAGALQPANNGGYDAVVQAIDLTGVVPANQPPRITFTPAIVNVPATDPVGGTIVPLICGRLFGCTLDDPEGEFLTHLVWHGPDGFRASSPGALPVAAGPSVVPRAYATLAPGTHIVTLVARDESGGIGTGTLTVNVAGVNTNPGALQTVVLTDSKFVANEYGQIGAEQPIAVTFESVTAPGLTWLESRWDLLPPPPHDLQAGSPPYYYEVKSNAAFSGTVRVCINTRGMSLPRQQTELQLHRLVADVWTPLTDHDASNPDQICADAPDLGTFAIFYPQVPATAITAIAGTGFAEDSIDPPGGDPRDEFHDVSPALQSTLTRPGHLAVSKRGASATLFVADNGYQFGTRLRMLDLATGEIRNALEPLECTGSGPLAVDPTGQFLYCTRWVVHNGQVEIHRFDLETGIRTVVTTVHEVLAMVTDAAGNLFYSDGNIHRVPAVGGASGQVFAFNGRPGALSLPYFDRAWTLAFDSQGHLLAGGMTLIRIAPGGDGLVNRSPDETAAKIGGVGGANLVGYAEPYGGDGLPALQARLVFIYQMIVASDGAVVFTDDTNRIRRIAPGPDGIVNGGPDEIVRTIAGFVTPVFPPPSGFATSHSGFFRGLSEDPLSPGSFIISSASGHQLLRFGIAPDGEQPPPPPPTAVIDVTETIAVDDGLAVMPSAMIALTETIVVDDGLAVLPSAMIDLTETIVVDDGIAVLPSAMIALTETIVVDDGLGVLPSAMIALTETIVVDDGVAVVLGTPPVLSLPADLTSEAVGPAGAVVTFLATAIDDVDGPVAVSCEPASGEAFPLGATLVTCTTSDAAGSVGRGTFTVTVVDTTSPVLSLPANIVTSASSTAGVPVSYLASATDLVAGPLAISCSPASGSTFLIGVTTVTCTATDPAGNPRSGTFTVTVTQTPLPVLQLAGMPALTQDASGRYVGSITVRNPMPLPATAVQVTTAILNTTPAASLPVQLGTIAPGGQVTTEVRFAGSAGAPGTPGTLRLTFSWTGRSVSVSQRVTLPAPLPPLSGWADLHTHPMSNLAFGGKLFHGAPDVGSLMPAVQMPYDPECRFDHRAISIDEALSDDAPTHGDPIQSRCGNVLRNAAVQALEQFNHALRQPGHAVGSPTFVNWPKWNDITHQKMWIDWIERARQGGLRVMVALSHNNRTLAEAVGSGGPISGVRDDKASSDLQINEIKDFVARHPTVMKVALNAADLYQIVTDNKIAVVLGVELDNLGNFNDLPLVPGQMVEAEIDRLYAQGVRYVFPVHLADNVFGDTAIYSTMFNIANHRETGAFWSVGCADESDEIGFRSLNFPPELNPFILPGMPSPPRSPDCLIPKPAGPFFTGHINARNPTGLTPLGELALKAMMKRGMIVDIDHMSDRGVETALGLAEQVQPGGGYPLVSGHSAIRDRNANHFNKENSRSRAQLRRIGCLQGMFGLGSDGAAAYEWAGQYVDAFIQLAAPDPHCPNKSSLGKGIVAFGTDANSLVSTPRPSLIDVKPGMAPRFSDIYNPNSVAHAGTTLPFLPRSTTGTRTWDYNFDGVAHYGMYADFVKDLRTAPAGGALPWTGQVLVDEYLMGSADYFFRMWRKIETQKNNVQ